MVQVLPYVPSFGEKLIPYLTQFGRNIGEAGGSFAKKYGQQRAQSALDQLLATQQQQPQQQMTGSMPMEGMENNAELPTGQLPQNQPYSLSKLNEIHKLATKARGPEYAKSLMDQIALQQKQSQEFQKLQFQEEQKGKRQKESGELKYKIHEENISEKKLARQAEEEKEKLTEEKQQAGTIATLDQLEEWIPYTGSRAFPGFTGAFKMSPLNREATQIREDFNTSSFWVTDQSYTHFNKGVVTDSKLKIIRNDLAPNDRLSERANRGRINSLRRISNLPRSTDRAKFEKVVEEEVKKNKKIPTSIPGEKESKPNANENEPVIVNAEGQELVVRDGKWVPR